MTTSSVAQLIALNSISFHTKDSGDDRSTFFTFAPYDDRNKESLEVLRQSCLFAYAYQLEKESNEEIEEILSWPKISFSSYRFFIAKNKLANSFPKHSFGYAFLVALILVMSFLSATGNIPWGFPGGFLVNVLIRFLLWIAIIYIFLYFKLTEKEKEEYVKYYETRIENEDVLVEALENGKKGLDTFHKNLEELSKNGGLPEEYWLYGYEMWKLIKEHRCNNLQEAMNEMENISFHEELKRIYHERANIFNK